jgi:hypothetical protein
MSDPHADRARRVALNESLVRDVNERISEGAQRFDIKGRTDFLCECAHEECSSRIALAPPEYERVRSEGGWFVVVPGHELPDLERVIATGEGYAIVQKLGEGREFAESLDPRG